MDFLLGQQQGQLFVCLVYELLRINFVIPFIPFVNNRLFFYITFITILCFYSSTFQFFFFFVLHENHNNQNADLFLFFFPFRTPVFICYIFEYIHLFSSSVFRFLFFLVLLPGVLCVTTAILTITNITFFLFFDLHITFKFTFSRFPRYLRSHLKAAFSPSF